MPTEMELERLVVKMVGDSSSYENMLKRVHSGTDSAIASLKGGATTLDKFSSGIDDIGKRLAEAGSTLSSFTEAATKFAVLQTAAGYLDKVDDRLTFIGKAAIEVGKAFSQVEIFVRGSITVFRGLDAALDAVEFAATVDILKSMDSAAGSVVKSFTAAKNAVVALTGATQIFTVTAGLWVAGITAAIVAGYNIYRVINDEMTARDSLNKMLEKQHSKVLALTEAYNEQTASISELTSESAILERRDEMLSEEIDAATAKLNEYQKLREAAKRREKETRGSLFARSEFRTAVSDLEEAIAARRKLLEAPHAKAGFMPKEEVEGHKKAIEDMSERLEKLKEKGPNLTTFRNWLGFGRGAKETAAEVARIEVLLGGVRKRLDELEPKVGKVSESLVKEVTRANMSLELQLALWGKVGNEALIARAKLGGLGDSEDPKHQKLLENLEELAAKVAHLQTIDKAAASFTGFIDRLTREGEALRSSASAAEAYRVAMEAASVGVPFDLVADQLMGAMKQLEVDKFNKSVKDTIQSLSDEAATFGKTAEQIRLYKLEKEATRLGVEIDEGTRDRAKALMQFKKDAEERKKLIEEGKNLTKSLRTPVEQYRDTLKELDKLQGAGAITGETYNRALEAAKKKLEDAEKAANNTAGAFQRFDAAAFGSTEMLQRLEQFREGKAFTIKKDIQSAITQEVKAGVDVRGGQNINDDKMIDVLKKIEENTGKQLEKSPVEMIDAAIV